LDHANQVKRRQFRRNLPKRLPHAPPLPIANHRVAQSLAHPNPQPGGPHVVHICVDHESPVSLPASTAKHARKILVASQPSRPIE
jgi:hypothetical protein